MATIQTQIALVHIDSGLNAQSVVQRTAAAAQFTPLAVEVGAADETIPLGDIITAKQVLVKLLSGDPLQVGLDGSTYPFRLVEAEEATLLRLDVEGLKEISTVICGADSASSLSGTYFDIADRNGTVRVWNNMAATAAFGSVTYGSPANTDTIVVNGTTFTKDTTGNGTTTFSTIGELNTLISGLASISSTSNGTVISIVADTPGTAGNSITLDKTGSALTLSAANLTGGSAASTPPATPGGGRLIPVVFAEDAAATTIAAAMAAAIDADAEFVATVNTDTVTITDMHTGDRAPITTSIPGWSVNPSNTGAASPVIHLKSLGTSQVVVAVAPH